MDVSSLDNNFLWPANQPLLWTTPASEARRILITGASGFVGGRVADRVVGMSKCHHDGHLGSTIL